MKKRATTLHIKNSELCGSLDIAAHILPRQICDLTTLKGCKFGSLGYQTEIALYDATFSYTNR